MPMHSNMMVFGTNTALALSVGASATSTPEIVVGFKRQEVVLMPLLANTALVPDDGKTSDKLVPCPEVKVQPLTAEQQSVLANCKFVGIQGGQDLDSYSVMASFGAKFDAKGSPNTAASGGLAQYFATGLAARKLADKAGAAAVSTGSAAIVNARLNASEEDSAAVVQMMDSPQVKAQAAAMDKDIQTVLQRVAAQDAASLPDHLAKLDKSLVGVSPVFSMACTAKSPIACMDIIRGSSFPVLGADAWSAAAKIN